MSKILESKSSSEVFATSSTNRGTIFNGEFKWKKLSQMVTANQDFSEWQAKDWPLA